MAGACTGYFKIAKNFAPRIQNPEYARQYNTQLQLLGFPMFGILCRYGPGFVSYDVLRHYGTTIDC